jgi:hypothetical protein
MPSGFLPEPFGRPIRLIANGWESTTVDLGRAGWELHADQDYSEGRLSLVAHHRETGLTAYARDSRWDYRSHIEFDRIHRGEMPVMRAQIGHRDKVQIHHFGGALMPSFDRVSPFMEPRMEIKSMADMLHFAPYKSEQIQIEADPTVDDLLAQIIAKQAKTNDEYFAEKVRSGKIVRASAAEVLQFRRVA